MASTSPLCVHQFVVQTPSMSHSLIALILAKGRKSNRSVVRVLPFLASSKNYTRKGVKSEVYTHENLASIAIKKNYDFIYLFSGESNKNHINLLGSLRILAEESIYPSLCLTVSISQFSELCFEIFYLRKSLD